MKKTNSKAELTLAETYAEMILSDLPPKQSQKQRRNILKACQLLQKESELSAKASTFQKIENLLNRYEHEQTHTANP